MSSLLESRVRADALRLWLVGLPGLGPGDLSRGSVVVRIASFSAAWVLGLALVGIAWAWANGFVDVVRDSAPQLVPLAALTYIMALEIRWVAGMIEVEMLPSLDAFQERVRALQYVRGFVRQVVRWWWAPLLLYLALPLLAVLRASGGSVEAPLFTGAADPRWFIDPLFPRIALIALWLTPAVLIAAVGTTGLLLLQGLTLRLSTLEVVDRPAFVLNRVRRYVLLCQLASVGWSCDLLMYYVATFSRPGAFGIAFVVVATLIAVSTTVIPHLAVHMALRRMAGRVTEQMARAADEALLSASLPAAERVRVLAQVAVDPPITWAYDVRFMIGPAIALVGTAAVGYFGLR